jgi:hypothetical protein
MTKSARHRRNDNNATRKEGVTRGPIHVGNANKRSIQDAVITNILLELKHCKEPTGRLEYGTFKPIFKKWKEECKWFREDMIHSRRKREKRPQANATRTNRNKRPQATATDLNDVETSSTEIEDLSADQDVNQFVTEFRNQIESIDDDFHLDENEFNRYLTQLNNLQLLGMEDNQPSNQTGRPIGSTDEEKRVQKERNSTSKLWCAFDSLL